MDDIFSLRVDDARVNKDTAQEFGLNERLKADKIDLALVNAKRLLGGYSNVSPQELSIKLIEGNVGEGAIRGKTIELQLPSQSEAITQTKASVEPLLQNKTDQEKDTIAQEFLYVLMASTVLHEGVHGLLDSKPGSKLAQDFERVSGLSNEQGRRSTLLDEGLAYAIQGNYAPDIEPLGSLAPIAKEEEKEEVVIRKKLGEALRSKVREYMEAGKVLDEHFLSFAAQEMKRLEGV